MLYSKGENILSLQFVEKSTKMEERNQQECESNVSLKTLFSAKDMTLGSPWKRIMEFAVPMLIGNVAQQLYNTADSVIVGHYVGDNALAAVGSASPSWFPRASAPGTGRA